MLKSKMAQDRLALSPSCFVGPSKMSEAHRVRVSVPGGRTSNKRRRGILGLVYAISFKNVRNQIYVPGFSLTAKMPTFIETSKGESAATHSAVSVLPGC